MATELQVAREKGSLGFVLVTNDDGEHQVGSVLDDSAAEKAGLCPGQHLLAVNNTTVEGLKHEEVLLLVAMADPVVLKVFSKVPKKKKDVRERENGICFKAIRCSPPPPAAEGKSDKDPVKADAAGLQPCAHRDLGRARGADPRHWWLRLDAVFLR